MGKLHTSFLHRRIKLLPQVDSEIRKACFKAYLHTGSLFNLESVIYWAACISCYKM
jgi:hypothetical protein